jgi:hypothetical protein
MSPLLFFRSGQNSNLIDYIPIPGSVVLVNLLLQLVHIVTHACCHIGVEHNNSGADRPHCGANLHELILIFVSCGYRQCKTTDNHVMHLPVIYIVLVADPDKFLQHFFLVLGVQLLDLCLQFTNRLEFGLVHTYHSFLLLEVDLIHEVDVPRSIILVNFLL